ncbi:amino acid ABC transporter substrate-binding protein [Nitrincola tibetensis]|uniref:Amino acid ABC transporter substrate-binding protein n=1 Tax=Nitrincola tibetensis TaxID=2219697 RepID=A0A364NMN2_9GAMM|nr:transporter substrate-binding domain-containing protein [Nitrincola tibetensis]RAU18312.1 amino acid ABC transporter substrate-binding protein [Nitrincola tibetensis]
MGINQRIFLPFLIVLTLLSAGQAFSRPYDELLASGYLRVGVYENFPPYSFKNVEGEAVGIDVDIAQHIADEMGLELDLFWMLPDEDLADDLRNYLWRGHVLDHEHKHERLSGKKVADVMLRVPYDRNFNYARGYIGEGVFAYENDLIVMMMPYQRETWKLALNTDRLEAARTLAVFQYHPIGVEMETVPAFMLTSVFNGNLRSQVHHFRSPAQAFQAMVEGEVSAMMAIRGELEWLLAQEASESLKMGETTFPAMGKQHWDIGIAVREADRQLGYHIEGILEPLVMSGDIASIFERYGVTWEVPAFYDF